MHYRRHTFLLMFIDVFVSAMIIIINLLAQNFPMLLLLLLLLLLPLIRSLIRCCGVHGTKRIVC
jgi:hypothetical protein